MFSFSSIFAIGTVHRGVAMIRDGRWREEAGELEPAVAVRRAHHGNLDALIAQSSDTSGPFSFDRGPPFELEAELAKEINRRFEVIDDDSYVVHPFERPNLQGAVQSNNGPFLKQFFVHDGSCAFLLHGGILSVKLNGNVAHRGDDESALREKVAERNRRAEEDCTRLRPGRGVEMGQALLHLPEKE